MLLKLITVTTALASVGAQSWAGDVVRIRIPRHSELTPVQRLNREGVDAIKRHEYEKAATLFYKAYLYDPGDPFTLNNLGYIAELHGELEKAHKFYSLATMQSSSANIAQSNSKQLEGKPMQYAFQVLRDGPMMVNRMNVEAMTLLSQGRGFEAIALLRKAQTVDARNPFTLNNLGVAYESIGEFESALKAYDAVAALNSSEEATVTLDRESTGLAVSTIAAESSKRLNERMRKMGSAGANAAVFTARGVFAANENNWDIAKQDFLHAYTLNPSSAFALNNRGYVAEMEGDLETAQFFYEKARIAGDSGARVGLATLRVAEGKKMLAVASDSDRAVDVELKRYSQQRRRQTGPIELTPRGDAIGGDAAAPSEMPSPSDVLPAAPSSVPQPQ
jgi:Flp pilus assembly protein TadD